MKKDKAEKKETSNKKGVKGKTTKSLRKSPKAQEEA